MDFIPRDIFLEIIQFLSIKEVFLEVVLTCKHFKSTVESSRLFLGRLLQLHLGITRSLFPSYASAQLLFQAALSPHISELDYTGFATSGGYHEDRLKYWVSNLYRDDGSKYCSRDNKNNINTAGVLTITQEPKINQETYNYFLEIFNNSGFISDAVEPDYKRDGKLSLQQIREFRKAYNEREIDFIDELSWELQKSPEEVDRGLKEAFEKFNLPEIIPEDLRRRQDNLFVTLEKIDYNAGSHGDKIAVVSKVLLSRKGRFTCPVETFVIFVSEVYVDIEDEEFSRYDNLLNYELVQKEFPGGTRGLEGDAESGCIYSEFYRSEGMLKPVIWGKFTNRKGKLISAHLWQKFSGNYLYSKLINAENRMDEMNDRHDTTNIDCSYLLAFGNVINLGENIL